MRVTLLGDTFEVTEEEIEALLRDGVANLDSGFITVTLYDDGRIGIDKPLANSYGMHWPYDYNHVYHRILKELGLTFTDGVWSKAE